MTEEQTEQAVLKYLNSKNDDGFGPNCSLTTIFEKVLPHSVPLADSYDLEDEIESKEALRVILDQMVSDGLLESDWGERDYEASYRLTDQGVYETNGFDHLVTESGDAIVTENGESIMISGESVAPNDDPITVDSSTWTGLTKKVINARNAKVVSNLIGEALDSLSASNAGNFETMQATAYLKAARELVDAPEPPSEEIWRLISRAADIAGLFAVFFAIFVQGLN